MSTPLTPEEVTASQDATERPLCAGCARRLADGRFAALAILSSPWARFIAAPYQADPEDPTAADRKRARLIGSMQSDTTAAEDYRRGATEFCEAFRSADSAPADEGRGILINLDADGGEG